MPIHPNTQTRLAVRKIRALHRDLKSWKKVSDKTGGINRGILSGVASGKRAPTPQVLKALGLRVVAYKPGRVCPVHHIVHDRICREQKKARTPAGPRVNWKLEYVRLVALLTCGLRL